MAKVFRPNIAMRSLLDRFDFVKVHTIMEQLDWQWHFTSTDRHVPSVEELRAVATEYVRKVVNGETSSIRGGGLRAEVRGRGLYSLSFELEDTWIPSNCCIRRAKKKKVSHLLSASVQ